MEFRASRIGFFHSSSRVEITDLHFERHKQSAAAKRWLKAAVVGNLEEMKTLIKEDHKIVDAVDNFIGYSTVSSCLLCCCLWS